MNNKVFLNKIWEILKPFLVYYILHNVVFVVILFLCRMMAEGLGEEYLTYLTEHAKTVTGLVSGLSMMISVLPLLPWFRSELAEHKAEADCVNRRTSVQGEKITEEGRRGDGFYIVVATGLTIVLAVTSSLGLNILLALTGLVGISKEYVEVADRQYGVAFGVGIFLYGLISPFTEEIVFRGLVFNRMRRYFPHMAAVIASGVLFGIYHGNLVQGLYGGCMGILMAYLYERVHSFIMPCLFHAVANMVVYTAAQSMFVQRTIFTAPYCAVLLILSAVCVFIIEKIKDAE